MRPSRRAVPIALGVGPPALAIAALVVMTAAGGELVASYVVVGAVVGSVSTGLGAYLVARVPDNPMGWLFSLSGTAYVVTVAVSAWVTAARVWGWAGLAGAAWVSEWAYVLALGPQLTLLLLLFPDGSPPTPRWRSVGWASGATMVALLVVNTMVPRVHLSQDEVIANPLGGNAAIAQLAGPLTLLLGLCGLASYTSLLVRLRRAASDERRRIAPYVVAGTLAIAALAVITPGSPVEPYVQTAFLPLLPVAATLCVLRYHLYDLEVAVRRSVVWFGLTVVVVGGYGLVVTAVSNLLHRQAGLPESLLAAGAVAAVFQPSRVWLQRAVGRALYGQRDDPDQALADLGRTLEATADPTAALTRAAERIASALAVPWVAIEVAPANENVTAEGPGPSHLATSGRRPGWANEAAISTVELSHTGTRYGTLSVSRRSPGEPLSSRDRDLLPRLAYPIAATAAAFRLNDDLRRSRERLVVAREEERRRLRHDLHDELGPLLAAIALQLDAATLRSRRTSGADDPLLSDLRSTAQDAIATVRRTVEDLRPPALDELGLVGALQATAATFTSSSGPNLTVHAPDLPALSAAVEVAAYRIAVEAATNAVRHANARHIVIRLTVTHDILRVVVRDDGRGLPADTVTGVGTTSMRERAEELAGSFSIGAHPDGGTEVHARLPIGATR